MNSHVGSISKFNAMMLEECLKHGRDIDSVILPNGIVTTVRWLRLNSEKRFNITMENVGSLTSKEQNKVLMRLMQFAKREHDIKHENVRALQRRNELHNRLKSWANDKLRLEDPKGSRLHHMLSYNESTTEGNFAKSLREDGVQNIVIQNDWARALKSHREIMEHGFVPLPFRHCCWELQISGVRVLAFTEFDEKCDNHTLFCVYGKDGDWVMDDYLYEFSGSQYTLKFLDARNKRDCAEFPRVMRVVHDNIRASCIMLDAKVAKTEPRIPCEKLNRQRARSGKVPIQNHFVVDLINRAHRRDKTHTEPGTSGRAPQRGHFRRGTWVHYDNPKSGEVPYVTEDGAEASKTWRRWHFAGDLDNMITKEYRL